jgi:hypothetical protein
MMDTIAAHNAILPGTGILFPFITSMILVTPSAISLAPTGEAYKRSKYKQNPAVYSL